MMAFEHPPHTIFCHCSKGYIYEETSEASLLSILKIASPLSMHNAARVKHFICRISMTSSLLYQLYQAILF